MPSINALSQRPYSRPSAASLTFISMFYLFNLKQLLLRLYTGVPTFNYRLSDWQFISALCELIRHSLCPLSCKLTPMWGQVCWKQAYMAWISNYNPQYSVPTLHWRHNNHGGVSNHQPHGCLLNRLFRRRSKKTSKLRVTGLCVGNSPGTGEFPAQRASNAGNGSIWWRHHEWRHATHTCLWHTCADMCPCCNG